MRPSSDLPNLQGQTIADTVPRPAMHSDHRCIHLAVREGAACTSLPPPLSLHHHRLHAQFRPPRRTSKSSLLGSSSSTTISVLWNCQKSTQIQLNLRRAHASSARCQVCRFSPWSIHLKRSVSSSVLLFTFLFLK